MKPSVRHLMLGGICIGMGLTLGKLLIDPTTNQRQYAAIALPETLSLPEVQFVESQPIPVSAAEKPEYDQLLSGQKYRYRYQGKPLQLELRDVVNTGGDIDKLIREHLDWKNDPPDFQDIQTPIGFYRRFTQQGNAYLTGCLSPTGQSFVTTAQFRSQLPQQLWQADRLLGWAIGRNSLVEKRCLWVQISVPVQSELVANGAQDKAIGPDEYADPALAEQLLDQQWRSIVAWWMAQV